MSTQPRRFGAYGLAAAMALTLMALGAGWWLGQRSGANPAARDPRHAILEKEINELVQREERHESSTTDRQRLLELLVGLGRKQEAIALVEPMADREPERWSLRLMLAELRRVGPQHLMVEAAEQLNPRQRATAYAVAAEIMRSDGPLQDDERNILTNLATTLDLHEADTVPVLAAMDLLHADVLDG